MNDSGVLTQLIPLVLVACVGLLGVWTSGTIMRKTGRSRSWGVLWLMPVVNLLLLFWLATTEWPIEKELREARESLALLQAKLCGEM